MRHKRRVYLLDHEFDVVPRLPYRRISAQGLQQLSGVSEWNLVLVLGANWVFALTFDGQEPYR
jgi:hypothetical protein